MATRPKTTVLTDDAAQINRAQTTAPGDAPADTYNPLERAISAVPQNGSAAITGAVTVNAVVKSPANAVWPSTPPATSTRTETYSQTGPTGTVYTVTHNIGTGTTTAAAATAAASTTTTNTPAS